MHRSFPGQHLCPHLREQALPGPLQSGKLVLSSIKVPNKKLDTSGNQITWKPNGTPNHLVFCSALAVDPGIPVSFHGREIIHQWGSDQDIIDLGLKIGHAQRHFSIVIVGYSIFFGQNHTKKNIMCMSLVISCIPWNPNDMPITKMESDG